MTRPVSDQCGLGLGLAVSVRGLGLGLQKFVLFTSLVNDDLYRDDKRCRGAYCVTSKYGRLAGTGATF